MLGSRHSTHAAWQSTRDSGPRLQCTTRRPRPDFPLHSELESRYSKRTRHHERTLGCRTALPKSTQQSRCKKFCYTIVPRHPKRDVKACHPLHDYLFVWVIRDFGMWRWRFRRSKCWALKFKIYSGGFTSHAPPKAPKGYKSILNGWGPDLWLAALRAPLLPSLFFLSPFNLPPSCWGKGISKTPFVKMFLLTLTYIPVLFSIGAAVRWRTCRRHEEATPSKNIKIKTT